MPNIEDQISKSETRNSKLRVLPILLMLAFILVSCESTLMKQQDAEIQRLRQEIARQRREIEQIKLAKLKVEQKRQDCNLAFRDFEKAQVAATRDQAIAIYRKGLELCPDDDVARYELGKIFMAVGRRAEAQEEFEAALRINPDFKSARLELKALQGEKIKTLFYLFYISSIFNLIK